MGSPKGPEFLLVDAGVEPVRFNQRKRGLETLFGEDIPEDPRWLTSFVRRICVVSAEEISRLRVPNIVSSFPGDLKNPGLFYAGWYEDGWCGATSQVDLHGSGRVTIAGEIPGLSSLSSQGCTVSVDGRPVARRDLSQGAFVIRVPISGLPRDHRITLVFDHAVRLPSPDDRPVAAKLRLVSLDN
jgi:hypothetical protein